MLLCQGAEFEPTEVKGLQQQRGLAEEHLWRYLMLWRRKPDGSENEEADAAWLKASAADARTARRVVIAAMFPELITVHEHKQREKLRKQAEKGARAARKAAAGEQRSTLDGFISRVKYKPPAEPAQPRIVAGDKDSAGGRPPAEAASPQKKQRTPTKPARPNRIADMFARAAPPAQADMAAQRVTDAATGEHDEAAAAPALRTPHLSGRFGAMGMASPAAAAAASPAAAATHAGADHGRAAQPESAVHGRARKQLFAADRAAIVDSGGSGGGSGSGSDGAAASWEAGAAQRPAVAGPPSYSEEASWPGGDQLDAGATSRVIGSRVTSMGRRSLSHRLHPALAAAPRRRADRKAPRSRLPQPSTAAAPTQTSDDVDSDADIDGGAAVPTALPAAHMQRPMALGPAATAAVGAATAAATAGVDCETIDLLTPERPPEFVDLTAST